MIFYRFFVNGMCRAGENCPYGHDMSLSNKGTIACKFYATGTCAHGDKCRFSHGDPITNSSTPSSTNSVTNSMNKMTLNPNASSWTPNQASSSTAGGSATWVNAAEFVPGNSKKSRPPQPKINSEEKQERGGNFYQLVSYAHGIGAETFLKSRVTISRVLDSEITNGS